ncbi:MAG: AMP-binding protein [Desertimonas sp.]
MYAGTHATGRADQPAFIMATSGEAVTYGEYEARTNRLAHLLRDQGLERLDHYAIFMENNVRYLETCGAGERAGLFYTPINSHLTAEEVAYIVGNSESRVFITSKEKLPVAREVATMCPDVERWLCVDLPADEAPFEDYATAVAGYPDTPLADEKLGAAMLYSSGTTGRPKGIVRNLPDLAPADAMALSTFLIDQWHYREGQMYLSPAPLYHSAPQGAVGLTIRMGGTAIIMERFDPEDYLRLVERYGVTHSQLVPTMFNRMLKLPDDVRARYDLSSLEAVVHAAAPCPVPVKEAMIDWWGPVIWEYYAATEAIGFTSCSSEEWLAHKGTVGTCKLGVMHILDDEFNEVANGTPGTIWFEAPAGLNYWKDPDKTKDSTTPDGTMHTTGDVGYVDDEGYLYLTDRKTFMIISGGVNIYPQETENLLVTHPKVADAAVIGVPHPDLGEEVKAVIQPMPDVAPGPELERELIAFCQEHLSKQKCPRSVDFEAELPRLPTGKLYKKQLRDRYWGDQKNRLLQ